VARIYEDANDTQWLSNGYACYPLYEVPELSEDEFFTIFDFTEKQREETIFERAEFPKNLSTSDFIPGDQLCEKLSPNIPFSSRLLIPFSTPMGIKFLDSEYLAPFAGEINNIEVYERISANGEPYFVVKIGMCLRAIIMPFNAVNKSFVDNIEKICSLCKNALYKKETEKVCQIGAFDGEDES
jgi:hypothetical protein